MAATAEIHKGHIANDAFFHNIVLELFGLKKHVPLRTVLVCVPLTQYLPRGVLDAGPGDGIVGLDPLSMQALAMASLALIPSFVTDPPMRTQP